MENEITKIDPVSGNGNGDTQLYAYDCAFSCLTN